MMKTIRAKALRLSFIEVCLFEDYETYAKHYKLCLYLERKGE